MLRYNITVKKPVVKSPVKVVAKKKPVTKKSSK